MGFRKFLIEQAVNNHITNSPNRMNEFNTNKNSEFMKLIKAGINSKHYCLYRYGTGTFYLADENQNYLGYVDGLLDGKKYYITMTGSEITGNFYNLMFTSILGLTEITEIISDKSLSPGAIKSYNNLSQNGLLSLYVITPTEYIEYSKDSLLNNPLNRVSVKQTKDANINEIFKEAFIIPYSLKLFIDKNDIFNNRIYCESNVY